MGGDLGVFPEPTHYRRPEGVKKVGFVGDSGATSVETSWTALARGLRYLVFEARERSQAHISTKSPHWRCKLYLRKTGHVPDFLHSPLTPVQRQRMLCGAAAACLGLAPGAMAAAQDQHEIRVAIVPPEEREQREAESAHSFPETPVEVPEEFPDEVLPLPADSAPQIAAIDPQTPSTLVRVYYGTNRPLRNEPASNRYGTCDVSIPARHQFGELERPSLWRLEFRESEARHVLLKSVTPLEGDACLGQMRADLARTRSPDIFVFIHGYNVSFQEAAMRTAQMAFDLKLGESRCSTVGLRAETSRDMDRT